MTELPEVSPWVPVSPEMPDLPAVWEAPEIPWSDAVSPWYKPPAWPGADPAVPSCWREWAARVMRLIYLVASVRLANGLAPWYPPFDLRVMPVPTPMLVNMATYWLMMMWNTSVSGVWDYEGDGYTRWYKASMSQTCTGAVTLSEEYPNDYRYLMGTRFTGQFGEDSSISASLVASGESWAFRCSDAGRRVYLDEAGDPVTTGYAFIYASRTQVNGHWFIYYIDATSNGGTGRTVATDGDTSMEIDLAYKLTDDQALEYYVNGVLLADTHWASYSTYNTQRSNAGEPYGAGTYGGRARLFRPTTGSLQASIEWQCDEVMGMAENPILHDYRWEASDYPVGWSYTIPAIQASGITAYYADSGGSIGTPPPLEGVPNITALYLSAVDCAPMMAWLYKTEAVILSATA